MPASLDFLAMDLGAESGRGLLGRLQDERLALEEVNRFPNVPVPLPDALHWDTQRLFLEMLASLRKATQEHEADIVGLGVDTWGVDFGLIGADDALLAVPHHYRDGRTDDIMEQAWEVVPRGEMFEATGIQFMQLNTVFQLYSMVRAGSPLLPLAAQMLMTPDLLNFWLTGEKASEFSIVTTSQMYDPREKDWARPMLERLGIPTKMLGQIVAPGTQVGPLREELSEETGAGRVPVIAAAGHDTAAAVAAVPAEVEDYAYISSGTWSLMGVEIKEPIITDAALEYNFTNEGGVCDTFRFLKNIMGLWLVQECRRAWERGGESYSYDDLARLAAEAPPFVSLVDPDDTDFIAPGDMPGKMREFCARTGQPEPEGAGATARCAIESLALKYRWVLERLEEMLGKRLEVIHIVGGGTQNKLLNQFAADATQRPVITGPVEATAIGNVLMQAISLGHLGSLEDARQVVRNSFEVETYDPGPAEGWEEAYGRFVGLLG